MNLDIGLQFPVTTLDGKVLLPAGTVLTDDVMAELRERSNNADWPKVPVLRFGRIEEDLHEFMGQSIYRPMFDEARRDRLMAFLEGVALPRPLLDGLHHFRIQDFYTYRHILLVFALTALLAEELLDDPGDRLTETLASPTHDMGKLCVPMEVLRKTTPLSAPERQLLKHHAAAGYALASHYLRDHRCLSAIVARDHHERRDGSGYPRGVCVDDLMVEIVVVADVFDALLSPRPYRPEPFDRRTALEAITQMAENGNLRWDIVRVLVAYNRRGKPLKPDECMVSAEKRGLAPRGNLYGTVAKGEEADCGRADR